VTTQDQALHLSEREEDAYKHVGVGNLMKSRTSHLDDLLDERLTEAFHTDTGDIHLSEVALIASEYSPIDLAYAASRLPLAARHVVYENLPSWEAKVEFTIHTDATSRTAIFRRMSGEEVCELIGRMPADEAVWVLDNLPGRRLRRLMEQLEPAHAEAIRELAEHDRHSAGRIMTSDFFAFTQDVTIGEASRYIREHPGVDLTHCLFVVNRDGTLRGQVPARNLIVNSPDLPLKQVMQPIDHRVMPDTSRDEVVDLAERYKVSALPVVDSNDVLVGIVTYEDVVEAMEDMADETIGQMAGTMEDVSANESTVRRFFARAPWLLVTLCGGLINAANLSYFEGTLSPWMAFAIFFVPLVTGMSGNVGVQCSTVLVRSMAIGVLSSGKRGEAISKELTIGCLTGLVFGIVCGIAVYSLNVFGIHSMGANPLAVAVVVSAGLFGACLTATFLGVFSPLFFARVGIDPAISSGPIVTAFNDVFSMIMYFLIARTIGGFFVCA
jgi:magnesium transporter